MDKSRVILSRMDCYAGKMEIEVMPSDPSLYEEEEDRGVIRKPMMYLQRVEGCGYIVMELTPDEADQLADALKLHAVHTRKRFAEHAERVRQRGRSHASK